MSRMRHCWMAHMQHNMHLIYQGLPSMANFSVLPADRYTPAAKPRTRDGGSSACPGRGARLPRLPLLPQRGAASARQHRAALWAAAGQPRRAARHTPAGGRHGCKARACVSDSPHQGVQMIACAQDPLHVSYWSMRGLHLVENQ